MNHLHLQMHVVKLGHHTSYTVQVQLIIVSIYELIVDRILESRRRWVCTSIEA